MVAFYKHIRISRSRIVEGNTVQREDTKEVVSVEGKKVKSRNTDGSKSSECNLPTLRKNKYYSRYLQH